MPERQEHYVNQYGGERIVFSTGIAPTGHHADIIIIDDPIDPLTQERDVHIYNANTWMDRALRTRTTDVRITPFILVMQRLTENDPTGEWLSKNKNTPDRIKHIRLPACLDAGAIVNPPECRKYYVNGRFDATRLPKDALDQQRLSMSLADFSAQYQQEPMPSEGLMFKVHHITTIDELTPFDKIVATCRAWDKAISTNLSACYTVGVKMGRTMSGKFVIMDVQRGQWGAAERGERILARARTDGLETLVAIEAEPGSGGVESAMYTVRNLAGFKVHVEKVQVSKVARAEALAVQVEHGNVSMLRGNWNSSFIGELSAFPRGRFKDQVDSTSLSFNTLARQGRRTIGALFPNQDRYFT